MISSVPSLLYVPLIINWIGAHTMDPVLLHFDEYDATWFLMQCPFTTACSECSEVIQKDKPIVIACFDTCGEFNGKQNIKQTKQHFVGEALSFVHKYWHISCFSIASQKVQNKEYKTVLEELQDAMQDHCIDLLELE